MATEKMVSLPDAGYLEGQCFRIAHFGVMMQHLWFVLDRKALTDYCSTDYSEM